MSPKDNAALASALRDRAVAELVRAGQQLARRGAAIHDGVHQARKSIRRARAVLDLAAGALGPRARRIDRELRAQGRSLSPLRDAHARIEAWDRLLADGLLVLPPAIAGGRRASLARARGVVLRAFRARDPAFSTLREAIAGQCEALVALPWDRLGAEHVDAGLRRAMRRLDRAAARAAADAGGNRERRHRWRRRARRLRQQQQVLRELAPGLAPKLHGLGDLTDALGREGELGLLLEAFGADPVVIGPLRELADAALGESDRLRQRVRLPKAS